jgi:hypothetical protein
MSKKILGLVVLGIMSIYANLSYAQSGLNTVYMEQIGSNSTIDVVQAGPGNAAGDSMKNNSFEGNSQTISIQQIGMGNIGDFTMHGDNASLSSNVVGNTNTVTVNCGNGSTPGGSSGPGASSCDHANIIANATGDNNALLITAGYKTTAKIDVKGSTNTATISNTSNNLLGAMSTITTEAGSNSNTLNITQSGPAGLNGFIANIDLTGASSSNTIMVTQTGTVDSNVQIHSNGSNNNITVHSGN